MTQTSGPIRISPSGERIVGQNDGDVLVWDAAADEWVAEPGGGGAVDSVFGRTGEVAAESGDYSATLVSNTSDVPGANVAEALDSLDDTITALDSDDIANVSTVTGATVTEALDTIAAVLAGRTLLGVAARLIVGTESIACPAGTRAVLVRQAAGGAGGGGATQTNTPSQTNSGGGGGGAGAEQDFLYIASAGTIATVDVNCGAGGTPGTPPGGPGDGGNTTVTIDGEVFTSTGGKAGSTGAVTSTPLTTAGIGGESGQFNFQTGSNFVLLRDSSGSPGSPGTGPNGALVTCYGGNGGSGSWGSGGRGGFGTNGLAAAGNGSGGGGGSSAAGVNRSGSSGRPGGVSLLFFS
jgi:hypothetical protein